MPNKQRTTIRGFVIRSMDNIRRKGYYSVFRMFKRKGRWYNIYVVDRDKDLRQTEEEEDEH